MTDVHILVIEDEPDLREGLKHNLELEGFTIDTASTGTEGLAKAGSGKHNLVLLDLMLPELSGIQVLRHLRSEGNTIPIIILSAKGQDHEKVAGLEYGADDYVTKPFALTELNARIRAILRRVQIDEQTPRDLFEFEGLKIDFKRFTVVRPGGEFQLSRYEAEILRMLVEHRGEVVTRKDLLTEVWGYQHLPTTRTVDNHIARLRKKTEEDIDNPIHVVTLHGLGYRLDSKLISESDQ